MRRNYQKSIVLHVILLLLILLFPFMSQSEDPKEVEHVIVVDFSRNNSTSVMAKPKGGASKAAATTKSKPTPPKVVKKEVAPARKVKSYDNDNLQVSQKLNAEKPKVKPVQESKTKVIPPPIPQPTKEELEAAKKAKELSEKKSQFANLLSKSKKVETANSSGEEGESEGSGSSALDATGDHSMGSIRGVLGNRKVLKIPTIKDDSQKKGRVVVKICVNATGDVVSSTYTMMGSTTSDTYLINLAEKGAKGYKFSPSTNPKECGKVTIDFLLK